VNRKGKFNVPFGSYKDPKICDAENLRNVSLALNWSKAEVRCADYRLAMKSVRRGDFIYLDPPYQPVSITASFTSYTDKGFTEEDQKALAEVFKQLDEKGCTVLLSNSDTPLIHDLYTNYFKKQVDVMRAISCLGEGRTGHTELIVFNMKT
jgi:DNA adenine methylase